MDALEAIRSRRTTKQFTGEALPRAEIEVLLEAAAWAPTHRLSQPWRFRVLDQAAIAALAASWTAKAAALAGNDAKLAAKLPKQIGLLKTLGAMVVVSWERAADPVIDREDFAAAAAAVQNLLLAATARGWGSFWSTSPTFAHPITLASLGIDPAREGLVGAIWLGRAEASPPAPARVPLAQRSTWLAAGDIR